MASSAFPASHPDREGRHLLVGPGGRWLRLFDWVDLRPVELTAQNTPRELGALLARLHRCAPVAVAEPLSTWYDRVPAAGDFAQASVSGEPWAARLADRLTDLPELSSAVTPVDPASLIVCHRDLHPENVLADK